MWRELLLSRMGDEILLAVIEDQRLVEFHTERDSNHNLLGNIYKGKVKRILRGMDAAFIDISEEVDGFLYVSDLRSNWTYWMFENSPAMLSSGKTCTAFHYRIHEHLREKEDILVQVKREAIDHKAPRVSTKLAITGTYLVYIPTGAHIGVSSRIDDPAQRSHLKKLGKQWVGPVGGLIFRTACQMATDEMLFLEWQELKALWEKILSRARTAGAPRLVYREPNLVYRMVRDLISPNLNRIRVDLPDLFKRLKEQLQIHNPEFVDRLELHTDSQPLMYEYGINREIHRLLKPKVWLKSGAYLVINQTEALVTIDVNTGKNTGLDNFQDSVLRVNLEATKEIVRQIRLRNLSGLILIDFIDMEPTENLYRLREALENELKKDRARTCILPQSGKSLMLLSRQKMQASLIHDLTMECTHCRGRGFTKSPKIIAWEIIWKLSQIQTGLFHNALVRAHPKVIELLRVNCRDSLRRICRKLRAEIELREDEGLNQEMYDLTFS